MCKIHWVTRKWQIVERTKGTALGIFTTTLPLVGMSSPPCSPTSSSSAIEYTKEILIWFQGQCWPGLLLPWPIVFNHNIFQIIFFSRHLLNSKNFLRLSLFHLGPGQKTGRNFTYMNLLISNIWCNDCIILIKGDSKFTSCLQSIQKKNYFEQIIYLMLSKVYIENVSSIFINKLTKYKINIYYFFFFVRLYWICTKSRPKSKKPARIYIICRFRPA